jgi:hypothetical protein
VRRSTSTCVKPSHREPSPQPRHLSCRSFTKSSVSVLRKKPEEVSGPLKPVRIDRDVSGFVYAALMNIDVNAAGLFAQVIPALLVFVALEDRLSPALIPRDAVRRRLSSWREAAVVLNLISLGLSLAIVVTRSENIVFSFVIGGSVAFLLIVLALLMAGMFAREEEPVEQCIERPKP